MKIIISHDVDHISAFEHKKDLFIPKFIIRSFIELAVRSISLQEFGVRFHSILSNKWQNIKELMEFDQINTIPATFFIGVTNGIGLQYSLEHVHFWIREILKQGFNVGIHGIHFNDFRAMLNEYKIFKSSSNIASFGIRMHYLRSNDDTLKYMSKLGYRYDASRFEVRNPYPFHGMWEFPVQIMDSYIMSNNNKWQDQKFSTIQDKTKQALDAAFKKNLNYFSVLLHDFYFSNAFKTWKDWYIWLIGYLKENDFTFINYNQAIAELAREYAESS